MIMRIVEQICVHPLWLEHVEKIKELEQDRIFCRHDITHFLDVARLAYIENLEKQLHISKELIYAAALLHDIGRDVQYTEGIPHDKAGAVIADEILRDCGVTSEEKEQILSGITEHRNPGIKEALDLSGLIYRADKGSRMCLFCNARESCNWSPEKKNLILKN